jgi:hypothetical protein
VERLIRCPGRLPMLGLQALLATWFQVRETQRGKKLDLCDHLTELAQFIGVCSWLQLVYMCTSES